MEEWFDSTCMTPIRVFLHEGAWYMEGIEDGQKVKVNLANLLLYNGKMIDEIVVIRPLTTRIDVHPKAQNVLKIYVDQKDYVVNVAVENRTEFENRPQITLPQLETIIDDSYKRRRRK